MLIQMQWYLDRMQMNIIIIIIMSIISSSNLDILTSSASEESEKFRIQQKVQEHQQE
jgi:hypothetical protein